LRFPEALDEPSPVRRKNARQVFVYGYNAACATGSLRPAYGDRALEEVHLLPAETQSLTRTKAGEHQERYRRTDHGGAQGSCRIKQPCLLFQRDRPAYILPLFELLHARPKFAPRSANRPRKLSKLHVDGASTSAVGLSLPDVLPHPLFRQVRQHRI